MNKFLLLSSFILLSACSSTGINLKPRTALNLDKPEPLILQPVEFEIKKSEKETFYILDEKNFSNFMINQESLQNRIILDEMTIKSYIDYYEGTYNE